MKLSSLQIQSHLSSRPEASTVPDLQAVTGPVAIDDDADQGQSERADQVQEEEDGEMLQELTSQAMRVNLFTPELPPVLLFNTNKNGSLFDHLPTSAVARDAKASGLQLIDNQCY